MVDDLAVSGSAQDARLSAIIQVLLPTVLSIFSNVTSSEYKATFKDPCRFDSLMEIFSNFPPYFEHIDNKFPRNPDLVAYYSIQMASTYLVKNGTFTITCLHNMISLLSKVHNFSLGIIDFPAESSSVMGVLKPMLAKLKQTSIMRIVSRVNKYEKNESYTSITLFSIFNVVFIIVALVGIISNLILVVCVFRASIVKKRFFRTNLTLDLAAAKSIDASDSLDQTELDPSSEDITVKRPRGRRARACLVKKMDMPPITGLLRNIRRRYKTRLCIVLIALCHSLYLGTNFILMSQASLGSLAFKLVSQLNIFCKATYFLLSPTTVYNIMHQYAIWLLFYAIRAHSRKLRRECYLQEKELDKDDNIELLDYRQRQNYGKVNNRKKDAIPFPTKRANVLACVFILFLLIFYNSYNLYLYALTGLTLEKSNKTISTETVYFCSFSETYSSLYQLFNQYAIPLINMTLFCIVPLLFCTLMIFFDLYFFFYLFRKKRKIFKSIQHIIEWPLYAHYAVYVISQLPYLLHQIFDLVSGAVKFPLVFPIFIHMKFTNKVGLVVIEMLFICLAYSSNLYIWIVCDKDMRRVVVSWFKKRIPCCKTPRRFPSSSSLSSRTNSTTNGPDSDSSKRSISDTHNL